MISDKPSISELIDEWYGTWCSTEFYTISYGDQLEAVTQLFENFILHGYKWEDFNIRSHKDRVTKMCKLPDKKWDMELVFLKAKKAAFGNTVYKEIDVSSKLAQMEAQEHEEVQEVRQEPQSKQIDMSKLKQVETLPPDMDVIRALGIPEDWIE